MKTVVAGYKSFLLLPRLGTDFPGFEFSYLCLALGHTGNGAKLMFGEDIIRHVLLMRHHTAHGCEDTSRHSSDEDWNK